MRARRGRLPSTGVIACVAALGVAAACTSAVPSVTAPASPFASATSGAGGSAASPTPVDGAGAVVRGSESPGTVYPPDPDSIVVYVDPGHGGCLDWGVPNPYDNTVANAEKTMTLGMARALRDRLEADGVRVVVSRTSDTALAGDFDPEFGCDGAPFRDVNGDGETGFDPAGFTLARDELTARIDLANLARADVFVSIHINSMTENGEVYPIAATQTFYTDEMPWGDSSRRLAGDIQDGVVTALDAVVRYDRQDRGIQAVNYFVVAPPLLEPTDEEPDPRKRPRGIEMPGVLAEVGSMSLEREADLLASAAGQDAVADGLYNAIGDYLRSRPLGVRYDVLTDGGEAGRRTPPAPGHGPPFLALPVPREAFERPVLVRMGNTGMRPWPDGVGIASGWAVTDEPYLAAAPALTRLDVEVPPLAPGEAVELALDVPQPPDAVRGVLWLTLVSPHGSLADAGSPALQLAATAP